METTTYYLIASAFLLLSIVLVVLILRVLSFAMPYTNFGPAKQKRVYNTVLYSVAGWMIFISVLSAAGVFLDFDSMPPRLMLAILPMFLVIVGLTLFSKTLAEILKHIPPSWLVYIQSFRVIVELLLWALFIQHIIPVQMSFEGRNFDVLAGLTAPFAAYYWFAAKRLNKKYAIAWNIFGLILLINIVSIAILSLPTPFRYFMNDPANTVVAYFPVIMLPGILVPVAYSMHFFSLKQLLSMKDK